MVEENKEVELTEVVTQTTQAFKLPGGKIVDGNGLLLYVANQILDMRKAVG